eukprot:COSAG01_NODE_151_length_23939_cov_24.482802_13_plen_525_part_00
MPPQAAQPYALRIFSGRDKSEQRRWGAVLQQVQDWLQVEAPTVLDVKAHVTANGKAVVCVVFDSATGVTTGRRDAGVYMLHKGAAREHVERTCGKLQSEAARLCHAGGGGGGGSRVRFVSCSASPFDRKNSQTKQHILCTHTLPPGSVAAAAQEEEEEEEGGPTVRLVQGYDWESTRLQAESVAQEVVMSGGRVVDVDICSFEQNMSTSPTCAVLLSYYEAGRDGEQGPIEAVSLSWVPDLGRGGDGPGREKPNKWEEELPLLERAVNTAAGAAQGYRGLYISCSFAPERCAKGGTARMLMLSYRSAAAKEQCVEMMRRRRRQRSRGGAEVEQGQRHGLGELEADEPEDSPVYRPGSGYASAPPPSPQYQQPSGAAAPNAGGVGSGGWEDDAAAGWQSGSTSPRISPQQLGQMLRRPVQQHVEQQAAVAPAPSPPPPQQQQQQWRRRRQQQQQSFNRTGSMFGEPFASFSPGAAARQQQQGERYTHEGGGGGGAPPTSEPPPDGEFLQRSLYSIDHAGGADAWC